MTMTNDQIADLVRTMMPEIHSSASQEEEEEDPEEEKRRAPVLSELKVQSVHLCGRKRMEVKAEKEAKKRGGGYFKG